MDREQVLDLLDYVEIWVEMRFNYAIPAIKLTLGALFIFLAAQRYKPDLLTTEMNIAHPYLVSHFFVHIITGCIFALIFYHTGSGLIMLGKKLGTILLKNILKRDRVND